MVDFYKGLIAEDDINRGFGTFLRLNSLGAYESKDQVVPKYYRQVSEWDDFEAAIAVIGSDIVYLILDSGIGTQVVADNITVPSNIYLVPCGGILQPAASKVITINSPAHILASPEQQFIDSINNSTNPLEFTNTGTTYPEWWGVDGTDDQLQIQLAIDSLLSGGDVELAGVTYDVQSAGSAVSVLPKSNIWLHGVRGVTTLKCGDVTQAIQLDGVSNVRLTDFVIDGNIDNFNTGHGIRGINVLDEILIERLEIKETGGYGIGFQGGTFTNCTFRDLYLHDIDNDGIDFKNPEDINANNVMENIRVEDFGLDATLGAQAGIDIRGPMKLTNINISNFGTVKGFVGIRFRYGALLDANGFGAKYSQLTNFNIVCDNTVNGTKGVVAESGFCQISNGYIEGARVGLEVTGPKNAIANVMVSRCNTNIIIEDSGGDVGDFNTLTNITSFEALDDGIVINQVDSATLVNCSSIDSVDDGIKVVGGSTNTTIIGGVVSGSGGNEIDDGGTDTIIKGIIGWKTKNRGTGTILNGNTSVNITHGMGRDIDPEHIIITPTETSGTTGPFFISGAGATTFTVSVDNDPGQDWDFSWNVDTE